MSEQWRVAHHERTDAAAAVSGERATELIAQRLREGRFETWFESDAGRSLAVLSNGARALVMVLDEPGNPGEHAADPNAEGEQDGYVLSNGQHDTHDNRDTVPLPDALVIVQHLIDHGRPPLDVAWHIDR